MVTLTINNQAHLYQLNRLPGAVLAQTKGRLTFPNPAYLEAQKRGFYTGKIPREICGWRQEADRLSVPRGGTAQLVAILRSAAVQYCIEDRRRTLAEVDFQFHGKLRDFRVDAVSVMAAQARTTVYGG
jgi:hypothetical protein